MTAAQLYAAALAAVPDIPAAIGRGDFAPLMTWLRQNVHAQGSLLSTDELLTAATGRTLDPAVFKAHLAARYLAA
jgi:carboxypeptidase Taq